MIDRSPNSWSVLAKCLNLALIASFLVGPTLCTCTARDVSQTKDDTVATERPVAVEYCCGCKKHSHVEMVEQSAASTQEQVPLPPIAPTCPTHGTNKQLAIQSAVSTFASVGMAQSLSLPDPSTQLHIHQFVLRGNVGRDKSDGIDAYPRLKKILRC